MKKIAVIGAGYWGRNLVRNYHQIGVLQAVCDLRNEILNTITQSYPDVITTHNYEDLFSDKAVQGLSISTNTGVAPNKQITSAVAIKV